MIPWGLPNSSLYDHIHKQHNYEKSCKSHKNHQHGTSSEGNISIFNCDQTPIIKSVNVVFGSILFITSYTFWWYKRKVAQKSLQNSSFWLNIPNFNYDHSTIIKNIYKKVPTIGISMKRTCNYPNNLLLSNTFFTELLIIRIAYSDNSLFLSKKIETELPIVQKPYFSCFPFTFSTQNRIPD